MLRVIINFYKTRGLKVTLGRIGNALANRIGVEIRFINRKKFKDLKKARKLFLNRNVVFDKRGFYYLNPMPTENELNEYFAKAYWGSFIPRIHGIGLRDFRHYYLLLKLQPNFNDIPRKVLNFGAGHGGLSGILGLLGHHIVNIEPSEMIDLLPTNWEKKNSINEVEITSYDLIYGGLSLMYVQSIDKTYDAFLKLSTHETIHFWEVANAEHQNCDVNEVRIPLGHTFYFTDRFFKGLFTEVLYCRKYDSNVQQTMAPYSDIVECNGDSLIVVGRVK